LHIAAQISSVSGVRLLLRHGADADAKDAAGRTALRCCKNPNVRSLLEAAMWRARALPLLSECSREGAAPLQVFGQSALFDPRVWRVVLRWAR
jgi:hypothetical protein